MGNNKDGLVDRDIEFLERMTCVTEELEDLVQISKERKKSLDPIITKDELMSIFRKGKRTHGTAPRSILGVFRLLVVRNLIRGRLFASSYNTGKEIGLSAVVKDRFEIEKTARKLGLGNIKIVEYGPDAVKVNVYHGITSSGIKKSPRPICFFEAGILSGLLANAFHKKMNVKEVKCKAMGDPCCVFEMHASEFRGNAPSSSYPIDVYSQENLKLLTSLAAHAIAAIENAVMFEKTRKQVVIDPLTQIYNSRYFRSRVNTEFRRAQRYNLPLTLFMIDVDDFKKYNDRYGHQAGDTILKTAAMSFVENLRDVDIVARYGGDEFSLILPQTNARGARIVAERLKHVIMKHKIKEAKKRFGISISIGGVSLSKCPRTGSGMAMLDIADKALLSAKKKGKNNIVLVSK